MASPVTPPPREWANPLYFDTCPLRVPGSHCQFSNYPRVCSGTRGQVPCDAPPTAWDRFVDATNAFAPPTASAPPGTPLAHVYSDTFMVPAVGHYGLYTLPAW